MFKTMPEEQEEIVVKFDGTGEATLKVTETEKDEYSTNIEYTVTKGANTVKAYRIRTASTAYEETLEEDLKTAFADYPNSISGSYKERDVRRRRYGVGDAGISDELRFRMGWQYRRDRDGGQGWQTEDRGLLLGRNRRQGIRSFGCFAILSFPFGHGSEREF